MLIHTQQNLRLGWNCKIKFPEKIIRIRDKMPNINTDAFIHSFHPPTEYKVYTFEHNLSFMFYPHEI